MRSQRSDWQTNALNDKNLKIGTLTLKSILKSNESRKRFNSILKARNYVSHINSTHMS